MINGVTIIQGNRFTDHRGSLDFVNEFTFSGIRRFYQIRNSDISVVRAWQGHKIEHKYFFVSQGSFLIAWGRPDNFDAPSSLSDMETIILSSDKPAILSIPPGYVNGIKALTSDAVLTVYSNLDLKSSELDRWSYDSKLWMDWSKI